MNYGFTTPAGATTPDDVWAPRLDDRSGQVQWEDLDGEVATHRATALTVHRGAIDDDHRLLAAADAKLALYVTSARLVAVADGSDKAGGRIAGQLWWPWLSSVGYRARQGWMTAAQVRVTAMDGGTGDWVYVDFDLPKGADPHAVAQEILRAAAAARRAGPLDEEQRAALDALAFPPLDASAKRFAMVKLPGAKRALAGTARPATAAPAVVPEPAPVAQAPQAPEPAPATVADTPGPQPADDPPPPRECAECGHVNLPSARFCRMCGTSTAPPAAAPEPPPAEPVAQPGCPSCGAPSRAGARFCRGCGHAIGAAPPPEPPTAQLPVAREPAAPVTAIVVPTPRAPRRRRRRAVLSTLAILVLAGAGAGGFFFLRDGDDGVSPARAEAQDKRSKSGTAGDRDEPDIAEIDTVEGDVPTPTPTATPSAVQDPAADGTLPEAFSAGRYVQLASFRTPEKADAVAADLQDDGIDAEVLVSEGARELLPGFRVIVAGPVASDAESRRIISRARRSAIPDAFVQELTPDTVAADPTALNGVFEGRLLQTDPTDPDLDERVRVTFEFEDDGERGTVTYGKPRCTGALEPAGTEGQVQLFEETIDAGRCLGGGTWMVKAVDGELLATWRMDGEDYQAYGRLRP